MKKNNPNKNTRALWIYAAALLLIAIALIFITTLSQAKLVEHDGDFEVFGTLMQTSQQNISKLSSENITLSNQCAALTSENDELKEAIIARESSAVSTEQMRILSADILSAYANEDTESLITLLAATTQESLDAFLPGLYTIANKLVMEQ